MGSASAGGQLRRPGLAASSAGCFRWSSWRLFSASGSRREVFRFRRRARERAASDRPRSPRGRWLTPGCPGCCLSADDVALGAAAGQDGLGRRTGGTAQLSWPGSASVDLERAAAATARSIAPAGGPGPARSGPGGEAGGGGATNSTGCRPIGTGIFLAAVISAFWLRIRPREFCAQLRNHAVRVRRPCSPSPAPRPSPSSSSTAAATPRWGWPSPRPVGCIHSLRRCWVGWGWR